MMNTPVPTTAAAVATCSKVLPLNMGAKMLAVRNAAEVPIIRPPDVRRESPSGSPEMERKDFRQVFTEIAELGDGQKAARRQCPI